MFLREKPEVVILRVVVNVRRSNRKSPPTDDGADRLLQTDDNKFSQQAMTVSPSDFQKAVSYIVRS